MKSTGIVRGVDGLGRIVLPKELRTSMKLDNDAKLEIFVEGDEIILKKYRPTGSCDFCGEVDDNAIQYIIDGVAILILDFAIMQSVGLGFFQEFCSNPRCGSLKPTQKQKGLSFLALLKKFLKFST